MHGWITVFAPLAMLAGAVVPFQAGANAALGRNLGHPLWATMASLAVSAVLASLVMLVWRVPAPDVQLAMRGPGWSWLAARPACFILRPR